MSTSQSKNQIGIPSDPESFSASLAHVVLVADGQDEIIGQAWIAAPNKLVTCGHVVDQYTRTPASITVTFPASGSRYVVRAIKLHPSYGKGKEQLVRFDVAVLEVDLREPDARAAALPISFEKYIPAQQALSAIRYPGHLGQYTTSQFPLAQVGRFLGPLKKDDRFHLLHDLALAPGDSGSPLFDGTTVVAIHCGDTATLPGLNLPTTSIRMAILVDALRALGIAETAPLKSQTAFFAIGPGLLAFLVCSIIAFASTAFALVYPHTEKWSLKPPPQLVKVSFGTLMPGEAKTKPMSVDKYAHGQRVVITLSSNIDCSILLFYTDDQNDKALIFWPPPRSSVSPHFSASTPARDLDGYGKYELLADYPSPSKIHMVVLKDGGPSVDKLITVEEMAEVSQKYCLLPFSATELVKRIKRLEADNPETVMYQEIEPPSASKGPTAPDKKKEAGTPEPPSEPENSDTKEESSTIEETSESRTEASVNPETPAGDDKVDADREVKDEEPGSSDAQQSI